jgi:ABC-type uncharacterized transport system involved in gliding motility auxiliary subunit
MDRRTLSIAGIVLAVILFVALNTWGSLTLRPIRADLTENRQFTLSNGTRELLAGMQEPVRLRLYVSGSLREANPFLATYADRVADMLDAYANASAGRLTVELVDPEPFSVEEDRAVGFGLQAIGLEGGQSAYFGLAGTNSTDDVAVLPVLSPERERFLEYDLSRLVYDLANPDKPVVALISSLPLTGDPANQYRPWRVYEELGQFFDLRYTGGEISEIDPEAKLLVVVQPQELPPRTLFAIDQFVLRGGRAVVFVDPHSEAAAARQQRPGAGSTSSDLEPLLRAWGVELVADKVVADPQGARQVQFPVGGRQQVVEYLPWISVTEHGLSREQPITAELRTVNLASSGWLKAVEGAGTTLTPLITSSADAEAVDADKVRLIPDPIGLIRDYQRGGVPMVMAARLSGPAKSAYPDALPEGVEAPAERLTEAKEPIDVVVVADTDLLDDRSWVVSQSMFGQSVDIPVGDNADFVANAMDALIGSSALADLRGRDVAFRPFTRVAEIRRAAEQQYRAKEQELTGKLGELQQKLGSMRVEDAEGGALMTEEQRKEVDQAKIELLDTRRELRNVQHALRSDIVGLRDTLRFLNIAAVPILVALVAIGLALVRRARFRRRFDATAG